jgi:hypothetical protein
MHTDFGSEFSIIDMTTDARENVHAQPGSAVTVFFSIIAE